MPVHKIQGGYQYGKTGKKYYGKDAKAKAEKQALAIRLSGYDESRGSSSSNKNVSGTKDEPRKDSKAIGRAFVDRYFRKEA